MSGFFTAPQVGWGPSALEQLSGLGARRALVVVDPALAKRAAHRRVVEELAKSETATEVWSEVRIEPTLESVEAGAEAARRHRPDWIVAVGGGSTIDSAKGIWIRYAQPDLGLASLSPLVELSLRPTCRLAALPTTTGSGSETTWVTHLRDTRGVPLEVGTRELMPDWALLEPSLLGSLSREIVAETAADAIAHALEASASEWANPFSDALARDSLGRALGALPSATRTSADPEALEQLQFAATLGGLAVANSQLGVAHALAHSIASVCDLPHARIVAALLPFAMEFNFPSARERYLALAPVLGPAAVQNRSALPERLRSLWRPARLPLTLPEAGLSADQVAAHRPEILERARGSPALVANPRVPSAEELGRLLDASVTGSAVTF